MTTNKLIIGILILAGVGTIAWSVSRIISKDNPTNAISQERYEQSIGDELSNKCQTPEGYTDASWQEHMSHHPERYRECFTGSEQPPIQIHDLSPADLALIMKDNDVTLIDTHIPEQDHIPGTDAFIPYNEIEQHLAKLPYLIY